MDAIFQIFFILFDFVHVMLNVTRNLQYNYNMSDSEKTINILFSIIVLIRNSYTLWTEIFDLTFGILEYLKNFWNILESIALVFTFMYVIADLLVVVETLDTSKTMISFI